MTEQDQLPFASIKPRRSKMAWVWIIPTLALLVCIFVIWIDVMNAGPTITVEFQNGKNLQVRAPVKYRGVRIGTVKAVDLNDDLSKAIVTVVLQKTARRLAVKGSVFWIVYPEVGLGGFSGLDTVLGQQYISVQPGNGQQQSHFVGLLESPAEADDENAIKIIIEANEGGSLKAGSPVEYRHMTIGSISSVQLSPTGQKVQIKCAIKGRYAHLVRVNSKFWNTSGIGVDLSLFGATVKTESLSSLLVGGIGMATPTDAGVQAQNGTRFDLAESLKESWLEWSPNLQPPIKRPADTQVDRPKKPLPNS
jgi:paraquat-inducible protein B